MRHVTKYIVLLLIIFLFQNMKGQNDINSICKIEDGKIIFLIDLKWDNTQREDIIRQFDIDSIVMAKVFEGLSNFTVEGDVLIGCIVYG